MRILALPLLLLTALACSSDRYVLEKGADDAVYRLDKRTGDVMSVQDGALVPVEEARTWLADSARSWPELTIPQRNDSALGATLYTKWRDGRAYYRFQVRPGRALQRILQRSTTVLTPHFTVHLEDVDGFRLLQIELGRSQLTRVVDEKGEASAYSAEGSTPFPRDLYQGIATWNVSWRF